MFDAPIRLAAELWSTGSRRKTRLTVARHKDSERPFSAQLPRSWKDSKCCTEWHLESLTLVYSRETTLGWKDWSKLYYWLHPVALEAPKLQDLRGALPKWIQLRRGQSCLMSAHILLMHLERTCKTWTLDSYFGELGGGLLDWNLIMLNDADLCRPVPHRESSLGMPWQCWHPHIESMK